MQSREGVSTESRLLGTTEGTSTTKKKEMEYSNAQSLWHDKCNECHSILDRYHQNPLDFLFTQSSICFTEACIILYTAFSDFFKKNGLVLEQSDWTKEVQNALTVPPSFKGDAKEMERTPDFNVLCQKATKWIQYLTDIRKLDKKVSYVIRHRFEYEHEVEYSDEDEDKVEKQMLKLVKELTLKNKRLVVQNAARLTKIMGDIAVDIGIPEAIELIQAYHYDIEKGTICRRATKSSFYVKGENLSEAQKKLSPFAYLLAH